MEEWVGGIWHKYITRKARADYPAAAINFCDVQKSVGMTFRALGGDAVKRVEAATGRDVATRRRFLQKISGDNQQVSLAWQDKDSLSLPEILAVFPDPVLNRDLYLWLAVLAANHQGKFTHWARDNQTLVQTVLAKYPALAPRYYRLAEAYIDVRPSVQHLSKPEQMMEQALMQAILTPGSVKHFPQVNHAPEPIFLWLYPAEPQVKNVVADYQDEPDESSKSASKKTVNQSKTSRKKAQRSDAPNERDGMMIFRLESLFSWSEFANIDRGNDDSDDEDSERVAEDLEKITLSKQQQQQKSARIKINLDLPSASEDDLPLGEGVKFPEWHYKKQQLEQDRCLLQPMLPKDCVPQKLPARLQTTAKMLRAQFEQFRSLRYWLKAQPQGEELDLTAWLDFHVERQISATQERGVFQSFRGNHRDLSCLLLADISMSTDAHLNNETQVIDVVKDSLLLFSEALQSVGDHFALYGFSSVKRHHVRFTVLKNFKEAYSDNVTGRILALKPGFYTRMGAAIRQATKILQEQASAQKLLLILTDGKPNDIDHYEGRFGIEDTHQAILDAKKLGLKPFCITIDQQAEDYLPYIFGHDSFTVISNPTQLPIRLPQLYHQLTSL